MTRDEFETNAIRIRYEIEMKRSTSLPRSERRSEFEASSLRSELQKRSASLLGSEFEPSSRRREVLLFLELSSRRREALLFLEVSSSRVRGEVLLLSEVSSEASPGRVHFEVNSRRREVLLFLEVSSSLARERYFRSARTSNRVQEEVLLLSEVSSN